MISIRPYDSKDYQTILNVFDLNTPIYFSPSERKDLENYLRSHLELYFVVEHNGVVIGSGGINFKENKTVGCISWDLLDPKYHGKGIGTKLLNYRLNELQKLAVDKVTVRTS